MNQKGQVQHMAAASIRWWRSQRN